MVLKAKLLRQASARNFGVRGETMQAVLYVAHGSRVKAGINEATAFLTAAMEKVNVGIQELCFLELAEPSILQGVENCVKRGATSIAVVPILLLSANHLKKDIPEELETVRRHFPEIELKLGKAFGIDDRLIASLEHRLQQTNQSYEGANVLLIGRGSSDMAVLQDLGDIAKKLQVKAHLAEVNTCFLHGAGTSFEEALQQLSQQQERVFVIPYLLFSGLLKSGIEKKIATLKLENDVVVLCDCLGYDANVQAVLIERVYETIC